MRDYVIGRDNRPATADDLAAMEKLVEQAMQEGALGLSTSLQYVPDRFATTEEIIALAKVARRHGGIYITHQRSESGRIFESLDEVFRIAKEADIPAEVWHLKTAYKANWGKMPEVLKRFEAARAAGLDVTANQYPYTRASNGLDACLPLWVREGGTDAMLKRLADPALRERIKREMDDPNTQGWENQWYGSGGSDGVMLSSVLNKDLKKYEGHDAHRHRQGDGQGPARRGDGPGRRRPRRQLRDHLDHGARPTCGRRWRIRWCPSTPTRARAPRTARCRTRSRTRAAGAPSRASWGSTSARRSC